MRTSTLVIAVALISAPFETARGQSSRAGSDQKSVELSLSDEAGELRYRSPTDIGDQPNSEVTYALFISEDRDLVGSAALLFGTELKFGPLALQLGPEAYAALLDEENEDVFALAIGANARFDIVRNRGIAITGHASWSPDVLTFGSADNLTDLMVRGEISLSDRVVGFAGYRWFRLDLMMRERTTLQNELFAGINWQLR